MPAACVARRWTRRGVLASALRELRASRRPKARRPEWTTSDRVGPSGRGLFWRSLAVLKRWPRAHPAGAPWSAPAGCWFSRRSEPESGGGGHHRGAPGVDGGDDLLGVDALQIDRGRAEVGVAELSLDDVERDALAGEFDRVGVAKLVRREAPSDSRLGGQPTELGPAPPALDQGRPRVGPSMMQNSGPTGSSTRAASQGRSCSQPQASMPISRRRPPLPWRTSSDPRRGSRSRSASASASWTRSPARHSTTISARSRQPWRSSRGLAHHRDDLLHGRRVGRIAHAPCYGARGRRGSPGMVAGERRRPAESRTTETVMGSSSHRTADSAAALPPRPRDRARRFRIAKTKRAPRQLRRRRLELVPCGSAELLSGDASLHAEGRLSAATSRASRPS